MVQPLSEQEMIYQHLERVEKQYFHLVSLQESVREVLFLYGAARSGKSTLRHSLYQRKGVQSISVEFDSDLQVWRLMPVGEIKEQMKQTGVYAMELPDLEDCKCGHIVEKLWVWFASEVAKHWRCSFIVLIPSRIASEQEEITHFINQFARLFDFSNEDTDHPINFRDCVSLCLTKSQPHQTYQIFLEQIQSISMQILSPENQAVKLILEQAKKKKKIYQFLNVPPEDNNERQIRVPLRSNNETFKLVRAYFSSLNDQLLTEQLDDFGRICQGILGKLNEQIVELLEKNFKSQDPSGQLGSAQENKYLEFVCLICFDITALNVFSQPSKKHNFQASHLKFFLLAKFMEKLNLHDKILEVFKQEEKGILSGKYDSLYNIQQKTQIFGDSYESMVENSPEDEKKAFLRKYKGKSIPLQDLYSLPPNWMKLDILMKELLQCFSVQAPLPYKRIKLLIFQAVENLLVHHLPYEAISFLSVIPDFNSISDIFNDFFRSQISLPSKLEESDVEVLEFMVQFCRSALRLDLAEKIQKYLKATSNLKISNIQAKKKLRNSEIYETKFDRSKRESKESNFCRRNKIFNDVFTRQEAILQKCKQFQQMKPTAQEYADREALYYFLYRTDL